MSKALFLLLAALSAFGAPKAAAPSLDPVVSDGDKYRVVLDNEHVRVLRYHDEPGQKTHLHHHPSSVIYALAPFKRQLTSLDGEKRQRVFKEGETIWVPAESHAGENIGEVPSEVLIIELKGHDGRR